MNLSLRSSASLFVLSSLCVACGEARDLGEPPGLDDVEVDHRSAALVCDPSHLIVKGAGACPSEAGYVGERLFAGPGVPGVLEQYCRYTFSGSATAQDVALLENHLGAVEIDTDCRAAAPQGEIITTTVGQDMDAYFGWLAGRVEGTGFTSAYPNASRAPIDVAVVDTFPSDEPPEPVSSHGPVIMSIIESIACPEGVGVCDIDLGASLGLPRTEDGNNVGGKGGVVGLQSDLARGIFEALKNHRESAGAHVVINVSAGWESEIFGGSGPANMPLQVKAVYDAIRVARCEGALIVASAGNSAGLTSPEVALAPGRWEGMPAPTPAECIALDVDQNSIVPENAAYAPLVHAVGGLLGSESEMVSSREFGMPRLAAAASHAVARPRAGLDELAIRTGTSISAAVASAAASVVWSYRPGLSASQVMQVLYSSGTATGWDSDFGGGNSVPVNRIDTCAAVQAACGPTGGHCGGEAPGHALDCDAESPVSLTGILNAVVALGPTLGEPSFDPMESCEESSGTKVEFHPRAGESRTCAATERDPWAWLTTPQPPKSGCSDCILTTTTIDPTALLTVDSAFTGDAVVAVDVQILDMEGMKHIFAISDLEGGMVVPPLLESTKVNSYELPLDLGTVVPRAATVMMKFASGAETEDPMLLK